jgi:hypothetical protein
MCGYSVRTQPGELAMNELLQQFRFALSEGGDTGMLVAADAFDERSNTEGDAPQRFAELLRKYVEIQTYFRMSQTPNVALAKRYDELNKSFGTKPTKPTPVGGGTYSKPFGPLYTALEIDQGNLFSNLNLIADEPIRELSIRYATPGNDLAAIIRSHRVESMFQLSIALSYSYNNRNANAANAMALAIKEIKAQQLMRLTITGVTDTKKHLQLFFQMSKVAKGCELWVSPNNYTPAVHVATKRL